ncbi:ribonuclease T [Labrenzia sp. PHM005]|uniref:ribonuclease T2 family protein n=1 Tax=Labrenzia sp. PHM005 TaxID=2590016 RepID=UPI00114046C0|nr:ribonuclease T [Labrenzia sp. PHM005]QDG76496.1 ribonuclease T [Labrenzia sp. PHM005]
MRLAKHLRRLTAVLLTALFAPAASADTPGDFDFYVLALSWSPAYCKQAGSDANPHQCKSANPFRFIVHGLWPQYERGYPESCDATRRRIDRQIAFDMDDIMPSHGLIFHQWRKHGTCSGLEPEDYFDLTRQAYQKVSIPKAFRTLSKRGQAAPQAIENAFKSVNPGLSNDAISIVCDRGELEEIRICMTKDLEFRSCQSVDRSGCRSGKLTVSPPAAR